MTQWVQFLYGLTSEFIIKLLEEIKNTVLLKEGLCQGLVCWIRDLFHILENGRAFDFWSMVFLSNFQKVFKHLPSINWVYSVHHYSIWRIHTLQHYAKTFLLMIGQSLSYEAWMVEMVKWMVAALLVVFSDRGLTWIRFWGCV